MSIAAKCICGKSPNFCLDSIEECRNRIVNLGEIKFMSKEEIGEYLFSHHTHPDMLDQGPGSLDVVYRHEDIIELLKKLGYNLYE